MRAPRDCHPCDSAIASAVSKKSRHAQAAFPFPLAPYRPARRARDWGHRILPQRARKCALARHRWVLHDGGLVSFSRAWLMAKVLTLDEMRATPAWCTKGRPRFRADASVDGFRPSFRGHRRAGAARRAGARGAIRLFARPALDADRRDARRRGARLRHAVLLDPPGRQIARPNGARTRSGRSPVSSRS